MIDISVTSDGEEIESAAAKDLMYEVGLSRSSPASTSSSSALRSVTPSPEMSTLPDGYSDAGGEDVTLTVTVKEAKTKVLPELDDDMVSGRNGVRPPWTNSPRPSRRTCTPTRCTPSVQVLQDKAVQYALNEVDFEVPEALINAEVEARVRNLVARLEGDDIDIQDYLRIVGQDEETFIASMRDQAEHALSTRILLESIAAVENWEVSDEDIVEHVEGVLQGQEGDPAELVEAWKASGQVDSL